MPKIEKFEDVTLSSEEKSRFVKIEANIKDFALNITNFKELYNIWDKAIGSIDIQIQDMLGQMEKPIEELDRIEKMIQKEDKEALMKNPTYRYALMYKELFYSMVRISALKSYGIRICDHTIEKLKALLDNQLKQNMEYQEMKLKSEFFTDVMEKQREMFNKTIQMLEADREKEREFYVGAIKSQLADLEKRIRKIEESFENIKGELAMAMQDMEAKQRRFAEEINNRLIEAGV